MQKALDRLIQIYLQKETNGGGLLVSGNQNVESEVQVGIGNSMEPQEEEEFLQALHHCLEEKGVMKEVQAFLRQKLVNILKGVWPNLVSAKCEGDLGRAAMKLIEDFVCCHKLLFTYSVLTTELDEGFTFRGDFGKMSFVMAENLLSDIGIKKESKLSLNILRTYSDNGNWSLLECIINSGPWINALTDPNFIIETPVHELNLRESQKKIIFSIDEKMRQINEKYHEKNLKIKNRNNKISIEDRLRILTEAMEIDKEVQIEIRMKKFREEDESRIRDEIETRLKIEILQKEKELLKNFESQVTHMKKTLKREKQYWVIEMHRKEKELGETRKELVKALAIVKTGNSENRIRDDFVQRNSQNKNQTQTQEGTEGFDEIHQAVTVAIQTPREDKQIKKTQGAKTSMSSIIRSPGIGKHDDIMNVRILKKDLERQFLLKEANLRNSIDKLKAENDFLKYQQSTSPNPNSEVILPRQAAIQATRDLPPEIMYEGEMEVVKAQSQRPPCHDSLADTIALMQYKIESQAEELEKLRINKTKEVKRNKEFEEEELKFKISQDSVNDLDNFLKQSRRRFEEIEREARSVDLTVNSIQAKKDNNQDPTKTVPRLGPEIPKLPPSYRKSLFDPPNLKKYEYFPKYLNPDIQKPPPIAPYKPVLGSVNPVSMNFALPLELFSHNPLSVPAVRIPDKPVLLLPKQLDNRFLNNEVNQNNAELLGENYKTQSQTQVPEDSDKGGTENSEDIFSAQIMPNQVINGNLGTTDESEANVNTNLQSSVSVSPPVIHKAVIPELIDEYPESKPENNNFYPKHLRIRTKYQEKASESGALVKDKLPINDKKDIMLSSNASDSSTSATHSSKTEIKKPNLQPTWREILSASTKLIDNGQDEPDEESLSDIGKIETGVTEDAEDFWQL